MFLVQKMIILFFCVFKVLQCKVGLVLDALLHLMHVVCVSLIFGVIEVYLILHFVAF